MVRREARVEDSGEFGLATPVVREGQEFDHQLACGFFARLLQHPVEGQPVGVTGKELVAVNEVQQRHRLAAQRVDDVAIIDDVTMLARGGGPPACQRRERRAADEQIEAVIVKPDP